MHALATREAVDIYHEQMLNDPWGQDASRAGAANFPRQKRGKANAQTLERMAEAENDI